MLGSQLILTEKFELCLQVTSLFIWLDNCNCSIHITLSNKINFGHRHGLPSSKVRGRAKKILKMIWWGGLRCWNMHSSKRGRSFISSSMGWSYSRVMCVPLLRSPLQNQSPLREHSGSKVVNLLNSTCR